jgi:Peptidase propeptide and YPEB domain
MHTAKRSVAGWMTRHRAALTLAGTMLCASAALAQTPRATRPMKEDKPGLLAQARVSPDSARQLARARVPGASIADEGIEMENGKLVYSFDMKTRGRRGIDEVLIDALTGAVISMDHENAAQEAAERAQDERERRAKRDSTRRP